jgi:hypothetical protein
MSGKYVTNRKNRGIDDRITLKWIARNGVGYLRLLISKKRG